MMTAPAKRSGKKHLHFTGDVMKPSSVPENQTSSSNFKFKS